MLGGVLSADMVRYSHGDICFPCRARAHVQRGMGRVNGAALRQGEGFVGHPLRLRFGARRRRKPVRLLGCLLSGFSEDKTTVHEDG